MKIANLINGVVVAEAATLAVTWQDCGAKHATVHDLQPTTIETGSTTTLTGTGTTDEEVTAAQFTATIKAGGVKIASCSGDGTTDIDCKLPLGAGKVTVKAQNYPLAKGEVSVVTEIKTSSLLPAQFDQVETEIRATEQNGEDVICMNVHTAKAVDAVAPSSTNMLRNGPYKTARKQYTVAGMDSTSNKVDVWYPTGPGPYSFISYSHGNTAGGTKTVGDYDVLLSTMASYGYVIAAHESCDTGCKQGGSDPLNPPGFKDMYKEQLKVIDWAKKQSDDVFSSINFDIGVGISGHSMGGQATMRSSGAAGQGHGIKAAVMHHAYSIGADNAPLVPFAAFTGSGDVIATPGQTQAFYKLAANDLPRAYINKAGATHFEPNFDAKNLGIYSAAWFKNFLDETPQADGNDYHEMIFGSGATSVCNGGDGGMTACEVHEGDAPPAPPAPTPEPTPVPTPAPTPAPSGLTCDECEAQGHGADACNCGVCGSYGLCTWTCQPGGARVACDQVVAV